MKTNWKKGLFRAWIVVSTLWIIGVGFLTLPGAIRSWPELPDEEMIKKSINLALAYSEVQMPKETIPIYEEALRKGLLLQVDTIRGNADALIVKLKDETIITRIPKTLGAVEIARRINSYFVEKREKAITHTIIVILETLVLPPVGLLVLAVGMSWAFRGFRQST